MANSNRDMQLDGVYSSLPLASETDIRLMRIRETDDNSIACELRVVNLSTKPSYMALSYTWGPSTTKQETEGVSSIPTHAVNCNNHDILVTKNLHDYLRIVKNDQLPASQDLWVDMICIDQKNDEERTAQVNMMSQIYRNADFVTVWLGDEDEATAKSFDLLRVLSGLPSECMEHIMPDRLNSKEALNILGPYCQIEYWKAVSRLFQRKYFTRVWIIQEISLAKKVKLQCGGHLMDWDDLTIVSAFLTLTPWTRWICVKEGFTAYDADVVHHAVPNIIAAIRRISPESGIHVLLHLLISARRFISSDPRDKVYALLGLVEDYVKDKHSLHPIYGARSASETYTLAAIQILKDSDDLLLLAHAEGGDFRTMIQASWVPDWSCARVLGLGIIGYKRFSAAGSLPRSLVIDEAGELALKVRGLRLDDISLVGESKHQFLKGSPCPEWLSLVKALPTIYHTGQPRMEVFWRTLITDTAGIDHQHPAPAGYSQAFWSWMTQKTLAMHGNPIQTAVTKALADFMAGVSTLLEPGAEDTISSSEYEAVFSHAQHVKPFVTTKSYLGIGSESLRMRDSVWIVMGSRIPLVLRECKTGVFQLVGGAYIHGFMHGEALYQDPPLGVITIV